MDLVQKSLCFVRLCWERATDLRLGKYGGCVTALEAERLLAEEEEARVLGPSSPSRSPGRR